MLVYYSISPIILFPGYVAATASGPEPTCSGWAFLSSAPIFLCFLSIGSGSSFSLAGRHCSGSMKLNSLFLSSLRCLDFAILSCLSSGPSNRSSFLLIYSWLICILPRHAFPQGFGEGSRFLCYWESILLFGRRPLNDFHRNWKKDKSWARELNAATLCYSCCYRVWNLLTSTQCYLQRWTFLFFEGSWTNWLSCTCFEGRNSCISSPSFFSTSKAAVLPHTVHLQSVWVCQQLLPANWQTQ